MRYATRETLVLSRGLRRWHEIVEQQFVADTQLI